ncbi:hypothetical protein BROUX41_006075 [Berkeleyomyces rouxiae]
MYHLGQPLSPTPSADGNFCEQPRGPAMSEFPRTSTAKLQSHYATRTSARLLQSRSSPFDDEEDQDFVSPTLKYSTTSCGQVRDTTMSQLYAYATPMASPPTAHSIPKVIIARPNLRSRRQVLPKANKPANATAVIAGRIEKSPSPKKRTEKVRAGRQTAKIQAPLSEMAPQFPSVEVADIEAFVHRAMSQRHRELNMGKSPGKIKRPMNAFMLYRKAYQNMAKTICSQNNHQYVSQICGDSWATESMPVREQFNKWAKIERVNHQIAYPEYRFSPSKNDVKEREQEKKDDDETEIEDIDADGEDDTEPEPVVHKNASRKKCQSRSARQTLLVAEPAYQLHPPSRHQTPAQDLTPARHLTPAPDATPGHTIYNEQDLPNLGMSPCPTFALPTDYFYTNPSQDPAASFAQNQFMNAGESIAPGIYLGVGDHILSNGMSVPTDLNSSVAVLDNTSQMVLPSGASLDNTWGPTDMISQESMYENTPGFFEESWFYPYGEDNLTMLDSMIGGDAQTMYLASGWVMDDIDPSLTA